jgi:tetratricopeptide (TPR) repeat protein
MDKNPAKRYRTAGEMATDLGRYLNGFPIVARRVGPVGRLIRWGKRSRAVAASLLGVLVLGLVAGLLAYQLAEEKRQSAIDAALVAAWSGDFDEAENEIAKARRWGASRGRVLMLRGQVALQRNETQEAVQYLQQAKEFLPDSVAVRAMFAVACWQNGQWENFVKTMQGLDELTPVTPEDYLFKGYAKAALDPGDDSALHSIDEAIQRRSNWTIAYALRAEARGWAALDKTDTKDTKEIEEALNDARIVKQLLPDGPMGPLVSLNVNLLAATIYEPQPETQRRTLDAADKDFQCLESFPLSGWSVFMRYRYLQYIQKYDQARQEADRARGKVKGAWPATLYALSLYRDGECDEALKVLDRLEEDDKGAFQQTTRMFILAELPDDGPKRAKDAYDELQGRGSYEATALLFQDTLLYFLGRKEEAKAKYGAMVLPEELETFRCGSYAELLRYNRGESRENEADQLLKAVPNSRYHECNAHFFIGMSLLADGDRAGAREHFKKCVATGCFDFDASDWSRIFLERMKQDPNWPRWIPPRKQAASKSPPRESTERSRTGEPAKP